ncbi:hypothetical protein BDZ45DRAFT_780510 [Acephala macrosclerotiorum]|nr:hypothetical protein BDZ45DRAFT_780510 [Acephala macrosclerotiorum]
MYIDLAQDKLCFSMTNGNSTGIYEQKLTSFPENIHPNIAKRVQNLTMTARSIANASQKDMNGRWLITKFPALRTILLIFSDDCLSWEYGTDNLASRGVAPHKEALGLSKVNLQQENSISRWDNEHGSVWTGIISNQENEVPTLITLRKNQLMENGLDEKFTEELDVSVVDIIRG